MNEFESTDHSHRSTGPLWLLPITLALVLGFLGYQQWLGARSSHVVPPVAAAVGIAQQSLVGTGPRNVRAVFTYYLVGSAAQTTLVTPLLLQLDQGTDADDGSEHALKLVTNVDEEQAVRQTIDSANKQLRLSDEEPHFRIIDLRPLLAALP